jgi:hypothetical protein
MYNTSKGRREERHIRRKTSEWEELTCVQKGESMTRRVSGIHTGKRSRRKERRKGKLLFFFTFFF